MSNESSQLLEFWRDRDLAGAWVRADADRSGHDPLAVPRQIAVGLVADEGQPVRNIIDVASGAGSFLEAFLKAFPVARGYWCDASGAMLELAKDRLAPLADRVSYELVTMTELAGSALPFGADVVLSSRATHHLGPDELSALYQELARHVRPGGWVINLDVTTANERWMPRYRSVRKAMRAGKPSAPSHPHVFPYPTADQHVAAYRAAGIDDVDVVWKMFHTCLIVGRKAG